MPELVHEPDALHVCGWRPLHWVALGVHEPVQAPPTHAWFVHVAGLPHCPLALHVSTPLSEHCVVPGEQTPVQKPETHA